MTQSEWFVVHCQENMLVHWQLCCAKRVLENSKILSKFS